MKKLLFLLPLLLLAGCWEQQTPEILTPDEASVKCANTIYEAITKTPEGKNVQKSDLVFKVQTKDCDEEWCVIVWIVNKEVYGCATVWNKIVQYMTDLYWVWTWNNWVQIEKPKEEVEQKPKVWMEKKNALGSAASYLKNSDFSEKWLKAQLEYEWFTADAVKYALENVDVDYNKECLWAANSYLKSSNFSKKSLMAQLEYEWFTASQIDYAINRIDR